MAGLGFKDFQVGEVLTSSDVDGYLMQQTVMRFADSGARGSALGTAPGTAVALAEGMVSYLDDSNLVQLYDGSDWIDVSYAKSLSDAYVTSDQTVTSTSYTPLTNSTVTVTPKSTSSRFLLMFNGNVTPAGANRTYFRFRRDSTTIGEEFSGVSGTSTYSFVLGMNYVDSPATVSSVTYSVQVRVGSISSVIENSGLAVLEVAS